MAAASLALGAAVPEPAGFRLDHYRDPVPDTLAGGTVIHPAALATLIAKEHPVLIDVLPAPIRPPDAPPDRPWLPMPHEDIPGSRWLPDVGRGALSPQLESWFRSHLAQATASDLNRPIVFYCLSQCWMSWNAAKRAVSYGYTHTFWLPEGADGWQGTGHAVEPAHAEH